MVENYKIADSYYADYENEVNEEIYLLYDYLPVLYKDENEREYDEYFKKGVNKYNITTQLLGKSSIKGLADYYEANKYDLETVRKAISQARQIEYPQMKMLDMAFWQLGFDYI